MIVRTGKKIQFKNEIRILKEIPKGNWLLVYDEKREEFYLEEHPEFKIPQKIYGNEHKMCDRYVKTFNSRKNKSLGILLSGAKGTGKTLSAKMTAVASGLPTILITQPHHGDKFYQFLSEITQEVVIFIDEFEKIYNTDELQETFLSILDGTLSNGKMFIFTSNTSDINKYLKNRPGRIHYSRDFSNLSESVIEEVIEDLLENKEEADELNMLIDILGRISMDMLINLISEMNLYKESAATAVEHLNIEIDVTDFDVVMILDNTRYVTTCDYNPLRQSYIWLHYHDHVRERDSWYSKERSQLKLSLEGKSLVFADRQRNTLTFTPMKTKDNFSFAKLKDE